MQNKSRPTSLRLLTVFTTALLLVLPGGASLRADSIDDAVAAAMAKRHIPGLSLAVIQDGRIVKAQGYGVIEVGNPAPVTADTLFQAGSVSKSVAALGALYLVDKGRLTLDADVNSALKTWHVPENEFTKEKKVTLRLLLSHSAGLTVHGFPGYAVGDPIPTLVQVLDGGKPANTAPIRVDFVPGSQWRYAGGGYTVMQQLLIDVTRQPFPEFMRKTVLEPLGMLASSYDQPLPGARAALTASGYYTAKKPVPGRWHIYPEMAAAGLWTTPSDLARYAIGLQEMLAGRRPNPIISQALVREMVTLQKNDDGLGVFLTGKDKTLQFWHNGRDEGFDAVMTAYVERGQGAVVMINANDDTSVSARVMTAIADAYQWPDFRRFEPPKAIEDKEPNVTALVKAIFDDAREGKVDRSLYTPILADLIEKALSGSAREELRAYGAFRRIELGARWGGDAHRGYAYRMVYGNETIIVIVSFDEAGRIAGLRFNPE